MPIIVEPRHDVPRSASLSPDAAYLPHQIQRGLNAASLACRIMPFRSSTELIKPRHTCLAMSSHIRPLRTVPPSACLPHLIGSQQDYPRRNPPALSQRYEPLHYWTLRTMARRACLTFQLA